MAVVVILQNRRFLALWSGNALSLVGTAGVRLAYPLLALALFDSPELAGWVAFAATIPTLILQVPAGLLADTVNRRLLMLAAQAVGLAATTAVLLASVLDLRGLAVILVVAAVLEGSAFVVFGIAEVGAVRDVVDERERTVAFSFLEAEQPIGILAGRAVGGALFDLSRWAPFLFNAFSYVFCLLTLAVMPRKLFDPRPSSPSAPGVRRFWRRMGEGLVWMWRIPYLRLTAIVTGFTNMLFQCVILMILVIGTREGRPAWTVGAILAAAGVGGILGSLAAPRLERRFSPRALFLGCVWVWTVLLAMIAVSTHTVVLVVAWAGVGAVGTVVAVTLTVNRARAVPDSALGRIVSAASVITDGAVPIGAVLGGYLLASAGAETTAWILLAAMLAAALVCTRLLRPAPVDSRSQLSPSR
ncbi:MFS transporter [Paractinoplanes brasiliensis]|uniref:MFS transporter n=1 Tax=Paractinoplanes brasiliensis TaxID=52695 RepID=UPI0014152641|nr:MFS transporter [Actinoplanes brasiliensis]GID29652.1 MFS transporter [Actinoplanes brasiliensis]